MTGSLACSLRLRWGMNRRICTNRRIWLTIGLLVIGPSSAAAAQHPSASVPAPLARQWHGTAQETPGIYLGPVEANVILDLNPDGTFVETWAQRGEQSTTSGTWRTHGQGIVLDSDDPLHPREALRRRDDTLYAVGIEPMPAGRDTTTVIALHPIAR